MQPNVFAYEAVRRPPAFIKAVKKEPAPVTVVLQQLLLSYNLPSS